MIAAGSPSAHAFIWPNVPDQIARALSSGDVSERRAAAQRIADLPAEVGIKLAQRAMGDPDTEVRLRGASAAVALRMPKAGDAVMTWLSESDARLRLAACDVIRASPTERSVVALGRVLGDPVPHVRLAAAAAMGSSGMPEAVSPLLGHLDDAAAEVREEVARALGRIGDTRAVVPLIGKVQDSVADVRKVVARALGDLGDMRAASALMLALQDASQEVRLEAVTALGKLRSDEATPAIAPLVDSNESEGGSPFGPRAQTSGLGAGEVRAAALRALGRIGSDAAVKVLIDALGKDDPSVVRSPVRDALVTAGQGRAGAGPSPAVAGLVAVLSGSPSQNAAGGAALALGGLRAKEGVAPIIRAMQRGVLPLRFGLRALALAGSSTALPAVLEMLDDSDPSVRKEAIRAAIALLDGSAEAGGDGRPVDPASTSLRDTSTPIDEKIELVKLLGKTGAPRAEAVLLPFVEAGSRSPNDRDGKQKSGIPAALRIAALEALGNLRATTPAVDRALVAALDDDAADVRLKASLALAKVGTAGVAGDLLTRLTVAAEQDRGALGIALSGVLARTDDASLAPKVKAAVSVAPDLARDALIEALGRMKSPDAGRALADLASGSVDDRRKVAEALAGHPAMEAALSKLAEDVDPGVRANAVWSLGVIGKRANAPIVERLVKDPDVAVAGNAAAALGRIAAREGDPGLAKEALCAALAQERPYVRANALAGASIAGARCDPDQARDRLARDPSEAVRIAAADFLGRAIAAAGDKAIDLDKRALIRCAGEDRNASVALRCSRALAPGPKADKVELDDVAVYVVPDGRSQPGPRAPFALVRPDGILRLGLADRRGEVFEIKVPRGTLRLTVPAALAR